MNKIQYIELLKNCPVCNTELIIKVSNNGTKILYCPNEKCSCRLAQQIDHYCSLKGLNIKGLSRKTIEKLIDWGWINGLRDIYNLEQYRTEWESKPGFGKASVSKILDAIDAAGRHPKLDTFISAIGIPLIGKTVSKEIVKYYNTWEDFRNAVGGDWTEFEGFGPEISKSINDFDYTEVDKIVAEELAFEQPEVQNNDTTPAPALDGKIFVITGRLNFGSREKMKTYIESLGGKVTGSVSSKTDYLINNDNQSTTSKNQKAKELGVSIITEDEFFKLVNK